MIYALRMHNKYESGSKLISAWVYEPSKEEIHHVLHVISGDADYAHDVSTRLFEGKICIDYDIISFEQGDIVSGQYS